MFRELGKYFKREYLNLKMTKHIKWNYFMSYMYALYSLSTFFATLFGIGYIIYFAYYSFNPIKLITGIISTLTLVHINTRRPN